MKRLFRLALYVVISGIVVYGAVRLEDRIGLRLLPDEMPVSVGVADPDFSEAIAASDKLLREHRERIATPALSVAVGVDGKLVWSQAVGWADIEKSRPATAQTRFRIGSTSKALTAAISARFVQRGMVDLDTAISTYMTGLPEHWQPLTLRQLHSHTAGIPGYEENRDWIGAWRGGRLKHHFETVVDTLELFDESPLLFEPGTDFHYSSWDVALAGAVLGQITGDGYESALRREVTEPLQLNSTGLDDAHAEIPERAQFYKRRGRLVEPWRSVDLSAKYPGGGLISTPSDLVRFAMAWLDGDYLAPDTANAFWTPQELADGSINEQSYALGWRSTRVFSETRDKEIWYVHHGGVSKGAMSWLVVYPETGIALALHSNSRAASFEDFAAVASPIVMAFEDQKD